MLVLAGHMGARLPGCDSTMKNRPGIGGRLFLNTTAPTVFTCPCIRPRSIPFSECVQGKKQITEQQRAQRSFKGEEFALVMKRIVDKKNRA